MKQTADEVRRVAAQLIKEERVKYVIGYAPGTDPARMMPFFASSVRQAARLTWNPFCVPSLVKYLLDHRYAGTRLAVFVKGCDSRGLNRILADRQFARERVVALGLPCGGMLDRAKVLAEVGPDAELLAAEDRGDGYLLTTCLCRVRHGRQAGRGSFEFPKRDFLLAKCLECAHNVPLTADKLIGPVVPSPALPDSDRFAAVKRLESLEPAAKSAFWERRFARCLRCYACRNVCPACNCKECSFEQAVPGWQQGVCWVSKRTDPGQNGFFHLGRMMHVAGRCVDCDECGRVCPVNIPLRELYRKVQKDAQELFGAAAAGVSPEETPLLSGYQEADPDEFK
ncbi:MAG: 4Fe-4S dicluster domain-containing protein [Bacillota bacterium]